MATPALHPGSYAKVSASGNPPPLPVGKGWSEGRWSERSLSDGPAPPSLPCPAKEGAGG